MTKCSVRWCKNYSGGSSTISFHLFPSDPARKRKWVEAVRREETWIPTKYSAICSVHFETACFNTNAKKQKKLEKDAVPTLFLPIYSQELSCDTKEYSNSKFQASSSITSSPKPQEVNDKENFQINQGVVVQGESTNPLQEDVQLVQKTKSNRVQVLDSPRKLRLRNKIHEQSKKIKRLQYSNRRLRKRVAILEEILNSLTEKNLITEDDNIVLEKLGGKTKELLKRMKQKKETGTTARSYTPELKSFALTLHFYSARAYKYVRKTFDTCLPAPRTLTRWYSTIDGRPGFTSEALKAIKERVGNKKIYAALIIDEMKIMESEDYHINSGRTFGYVDFGFNVETDCEKMASEVLVFLLVALNESWKVPIAYLKYLNIRIAYIRKQANKKNSKKHILKKMIHNKSQ